MKIIVVSLKDAIERRENISKKMQQLNVDFEFFDAVDGRDGLPLEYETMIDYRTIKRRLGGMSGGEIGCALSHALLYKKIVYEKLENSIVLEDDAILSDDFAVMIKQNLCEKSGKDFIFLYHLFARAMIWGKVTFIKDYSLVKLAKPPCSCTGYYLNYNMALHLYTNVLPISWVADWNVDIASMNSAAIVPRIVRHPGMGNSSLEKDRQTAKKKCWQFGFWNYLSYKSKRIFSYEISKNIEGE